MTQTIMMKFVILQDSTPRVLTLSPAEWLRLERQVGKQLLEAQGHKVLKSGRFRKSRWWANRLRLSLALSP